MGVIFCSVELGHEKKTLRRSAEENHESRRGGLAGKTW